MTEINTTLAGILGIAPTAAASLAVIVGVALVVLAVAAFTRSADGDLDALIDLTTPDRTARGWLVAGARVHSDRFGIGTVIDPDTGERSGLLLVGFDVGTVVEVLAGELSTVHPQDELVLRLFRDLQDESACRVVAAAAPPLRAWCTESRDCPSHDVGRCTDRPCCSTCSFPTREDNQR